jgi:hypothetical protein
MNSYEPKELSQALEFLGTRFPDCKIVPAYGPNGWGFNILPNGPNPIDLEKLRTALAEYKEKFGGEK